VTTDLTLNGLALSDAVPAAVVLSVERQLLGGRRNVRVDIPGRIGTLSFPDHAGDRLITVEVDIQAASFALRRAAVVDLAGWVDLDAPANLVVDDQPDRYWKAMLDSSPDVLERLLSASAELIFRAEPYAYATTPSTEQLALSGTPDTATFDVDDELVADPIIELTPTNGTITSFTLELNGYALTWSGLIGDDDTLTISSVSHTVTTGTNDDVNLTGAYDPAAVSMAIVTGEFPTIEPGTNTLELTWTGTATAVTVDITWRRRYR